MEAYLKHTKVSYFRKIWLQAWYIQESGKNPMSWTSAQIFAIICVQELVLRFKRRFARI